MRRWLGAAAVLLVAGCGTVGMSAPSGLEQPGGRAAACDVPAATGTTVSVMLGDRTMQGRMMRGPGMMSGSVTDPGALPRSGMLPRDGSSAGRRAALWATPSEVPAGEVLFRVLNMGSRTHELVVLPLAPGDRAGRRAVGPDGRISEEGSLGEASRSCGAGEGDGLAPGTVGWTSLTLAPGSYELVCNLPWHYAAGMYAELTVTG